MNCYSFSKQEAEAPTLKEKDFLKRQTNEAKKLIEIQVNNIIDKKFNNI